MVVADLQKVANDPTTYVVRLYSKGKSYKNYDVPIGAGTIVVEENIATIHGLIMSWWPKSVIEWLSWWSNPKGQLFTKEAWIAVNDVLWEHGILKVRILRSRKGKPHWKEGFVKKPV